MTSLMISIGIIGNSYLTPQRIETLSGLSHIRLSGIYPTGNKIPEKSNISDEIKYIESYQDLMNRSDGIVFPEHSCENLSLIISALKNSKHLLLANPYYFELEKFDYLLKLAEEANVILKLRQSLHFTQAIIAVKAIITNPVYTDITRSIKNGHSENHAYNLIIPTLLECVEAIIVNKNTNVKRIHMLNTPASEGIPIVFNTRIEFDNGSVTNITINRFARENTFNCHYYKDGTHVSIDLLKHYLTIRKIDHSKEDTEKQYISEDQTDPVIEEIIDFAQNIITHSFPQQLPENGYPAYHIARRILEKMGIYSYG